MVTPRCSLGLLMLLTSVAACTPRLCPCEGNPGVRPELGPEPRSEGLLVDDFEDGDGQALLGGYWYTYDDHEDGGGSFVEVAGQAGAMQMVGPGHASERALELGYRLDQGALGYPPFVGLGLGLGSAHADLSDYAALQYSYRGPAHEVRIETANVEAHDFHAVKLPASSAWRTVTLEFSLFAQGGWGPRVPFAIEQSKAIGWQVRGQTGDAGELLIDDVRLLGADALGPRTPNLALEEPAPPAPAKLIDRDHHTPLQALALDQLNRGYNLTNWLEQARFDNHELYNEAFVEHLARAGFESLRLPVDLDLYVTAKTRVGGELRVEVDAQLFAILDNFERWTRAHGLGLTITYHQYDHSLVIEDPDSTDEMVALWAELAEHFAGKRHQSLFFELLNEPELAAGKRGPSPSEWTELSTKMIAAIREHDPERVLLFGDVKWYDLDQIVQRTPFADPNIIYVFHFYDPFIFTHQGASWAGLETTHDIPYPYASARWSDRREDLGFSELNAAWQLDQLDHYYEQGNRNALRNRLVKVKTWALEHDVALICNEFGVYDARARKEDMLRYYRDLTELFTELEIPWTVWFQLMDAKTGALDPDYAQALGLGG